MFEYLPSLWRSSPLSTHCHFPSKKLNVEASLLHSHWSVELEYIPLGISAFKSSHSNPPLPKFFLSLTLSRMPSTTPLLIYWREGLSITILAEYSVLLFTISKKQMVQKTVFIVHNETGDLYLGLLYNLQRVFRACEGSNSGIQ